MQYNLFFRLFPEADHPVNVLSAAAEARGANAARRYSRRGEVGDALGQVHLDIDVVAGRGRARVGHRDGYSGQLILTARVWIDLYEWWSISTRRVAEVIEMKTRNLDYSNGEICEVMEHRDMTGVLNERR